VLNALARCNKAYIHIKTAFEDKDLCKGITGARWSQTDKQWTYPKTPQSARNIYMAFGKKLLADKEFAELLKKSYEVDDLKQRADSLEPIPITTMSPWKHQLLAYHMVKSQPSTMLALAMGTGKTKIVIDAIQNSPDIRRILVVSPLSVVRVWGKEFKKHYALGETFIIDKDIITGKSILNVIILPLDKGGVASKLNRIIETVETVDMYGCRFVIVINYESAWREPVRNWLLMNSFDIVVCDEIHKIKAPGSKISKFMELLGNTIPKKIGMTGTPMPHSPLDVYAQYRFLDKGIFGTSFAKFRDQYAIMGGYGGYQIEGFKNQEELNTKFYSIALRVGKEVLDLPPFVEEERFCQLSPAARKIYNSLENSLVALIGGGTITAANGLTLLLRLQQLTGGFLSPDLDLEHPEKIPEQVDNSKEKLLADIMDDISINDAIVVFCRFTQDIKTVKKIAVSQMRKAYELTGQKNELDAWQKDNTGSVFAVQIQAGGLGIDLTRAHYCLYYSVGFSLGDFEQSQARVHRPGQKDTVTYIKLITEDTVDEKVYDALTQKKNVIESVLAQLSGSAPKIEIIEETGGDDDSLE
jgi:SNF2 family DNA or RNA helicase